MDMNNPTSSVLSKGNCTKIEYTVFPEKLRHPDLGEYRTYGIRVTSFGLTETVHDVSVCKNTVSQIVETMNRLQLSPIHLMDVLLDNLP